LDDLCRGRGLAIKGDAIEGEKALSILDLRSMPVHTLLQVDVAVIGGGPAGLTIARELTGKADVLVLDSGGPSYEPGPQALNAVENTGEPSGGRQAPEGRGYNGSLSWLNAIPAFELRNRMLGGSTHTWIGKCAAFDDMDFALRPWLRLSGWPFERNELMPHLGRAAELLNLGPNVYDEKLHDLLRTAPEELRLDAKSLRYFFWQFSHERKKRGEPMRFANVARGLAQSGTKFLTNANVTEIRAEQRGYHSLSVASAEGNTATVRAKMVVLCCGGVENARLLLASNSLSPAGLGNTRGTVGRYLADHPRTTLMRFRKSRDIDAVTRHFNFYGLKHGGAPHFYLRGLSLSPAIQAREGLTNCAAYPVQIHAADDPWAALKRLAKGGGKSVIGDLLTVAGSAGMVASGAYQRLVKMRGLPHRSAELRFDVMAEQQLDPESRVTLSEKLDRFGKPIARVNWKIGETEVESIARLAQTIAVEFQRLGLPEPELAEWIASGDRAAAAFMDMAHPSCTTRMGSDPATSVVDRNAMVHGVDGLYVAGSSVFPTAGHANPTLMLVALSMRLADHLSERLAGERRPASGPQQSRQVV
jgi:choline dehydrogenase-like flavoprotein